MMVQPLLLRAIVPWLRLRVRQASTRLGSEIVSRVPREGWRDHPRTQRRQATLGKDSDIFRGNENAYLSAPMLGPRNAADPLYERPGEEIHRRSLLLSLQFLEGNITRPGP